MTPKHLREKYKGDKRKAREEYKKQLCEASLSHQMRMEEYYITTGTPRPANPPKRSVLEEVGNAVTHGLGAVFAMIAFVLMLLASDTPREYVSSVIYSGGMFVMFTSSCLYHAFRHGSAVKRLFRRFDYSSIYLLIGATFAPVLICYFGDAFGLTFIAVQWSVIALGIALIGVFGPSRLRYVHTPLYVILGWSALILLPRMMEGNMPLAMWILAGGVIYSIGIIPYVMNMRASHFIWHFFVLGGALTQWIGIYLYLFKI